MTLKVTIDSQSNLANISVIIPVWHQETELETLLRDLEKSNAEIIQSQQGSRAKSMNTGAKQAMRDYLWFVHADSRITAENIESLSRSLQKYPDALHYFKLKFRGGGLSVINAGGANIRSTMFGLPYGDQALCISKQQFTKIGGYPEDTPYGEDLLFVRLAKKCDVELAEIPSYIESSARKYQKQGWIKTSLIHWKIMFELLLKKL